MISTPAVDQDEEIRRLWTDFNIRGHRALLTPSGNGSLGKKADSKVKFEVFSALAFGFRGASVAGWQSHTRS